MSKERARRREARLAAAEAERAARERAARRRAAIRRAVPRPALPRWLTGRTGKIFARRSRTQRAAIATAVMLALVVVWLTVGPLSVRIGLTALVLVATPALVVVALDRRI
jgi:hypothetical protein